MAGSDAASLIRAEMRVSGNDAELFIYAEKSGNALSIQEDA